MNEVFFALTNHLRSENLILTHRSTISSGGTFCTRISPIRVDDRIRSIRRFPGYQYMRKLCRPCRREALGPMLVENRTRKERVHLKTLKLEESATFCLI